MLQQSTVLSLRCEQIIGREGVKTATQITGNFHFTITGFKPASLKSHCQLCGAQYDCTCVDLQLYYSCIMRTHIFGKKTWGKSAHYT